MKRAASAQELLQRLDDGQIVPVAAARWARWRDRFEPQETVPTALGGTIEVVRWPAGARRRRWGVVEEPGPGERVVRPLPDRAAVRALIADRLAAYERMWDG